MNTALFIARRMQQHKHNKSSVSSRIINIATVAVTLGIAAILIAIATAKGLQKEIRNKAVAFNGHIAVTPFENNESQLSILSFQDSPELRGRMLDQGEITKINPYIIKGGMLRNSEAFEGILFKGVAADYSWEKLESFLIDGRFPKNDAKKNNEILISSVLASRLSLSLGDRVVAYFQNDSSQRLPNRRQYTVVGLFYSGFQEIDQNVVFGAMEQLQRLNRWEADQIGGYELFLEDIGSTEKVSGAIYDLLPSHLDSIPLTQKYATIFQWIKLFDFNTLIIIVVMIFVGVINMATALLVLILERSRMVGLLKTLGSENVLIQKIFLYNGIVIMSKGMLWGNVLGLLFYFSQHYLGWISLDPETYYVNKAPVALSWMEVVTTNMLFLCVSSLMLWIPSRIVLKIAPSKVLRFR